MRAALATKLRCTHPAGSFAEELQRLAYWLPPHLRPLLTAFRHWQQQYQGAADPQSRLEIERRALDALPRRLTNLPERRLLRAFFRRLAQAQAASQAARREALAGKSVDPELETRAMVALLDWLQTQTPHPELRGWLVRLLEVWWSELHPLPPPRPKGPRGV